MTVLVAAVDPGPRTGQMRPATTGQSGPHHRCMLGLKLLLVFDQQVAKLSSTYRTNPYRIAQAVAAARLGTANLRKMLLMCRLTVRLLIASISATLRSVWPDATRDSTSCSRLVSRGASVYIVVVLPSGCLSSRWFGLP